MDKMVLTDPTIFPTDSILQAALGPVFTIYHDFIERFVGPEMALSLEWHYYNDGKAWLGKVTHKKKTVFWLSVWDACFKLSFYFTEKTRAGVMALPIDEAYKQQVNQAVPIGKLIPLVIEIRGPESVEDALTIIRYKKNLK
ncbi:MAG: DUF3788 family protein [Candidatus Delongbacteria bacterium]|nr:DUF3788 family protein [Candidatus Delongbacteria bacterium]